MIYRKQPALLRSRGKHKTAKSCSQSHKNVVGMEGRRGLQAVSSKLQVGCRIINLLIKTKIPCNYSRVFIMMFFFFGIGLTIAKSTSPEFSRRTLVRRYLKLKLVACHFLVSCYFVLAPSYTILFLNAFATASLLLFTCSFS